MTSFEIERRRFTKRAIDELGAVGSRFSNWPVVYVLNDRRSVYVGETLNAAKRLAQHRSRRSHNHAMDEVRIVLDDRFNKSVCLDLESRLIRYFSGDGLRQVRNLNHGVTDADYFDRHTYEQTFDEIFDRLREEGLFQQTRHEIENSDLFKLSPFKALTPEQRASVENIVEGLLDDLSKGGTSMSVVQGAAGTGKTIVAIYLMKLLRDIGEADDLDLHEADSAFTDFFTSGYREAAEGLRIGLVIPQQSLRKSVEEVFARTPGLRKTMVLSPFTVGSSKERFDLLLVDEAHRLTRRASQASPSLTKRYGEINERLFGADADRYTQLDWIRAQSDHQILFLDSTQSVRPADVSQKDQQALLREAKRDGRLYQLTTQMRVKAGADYIGLIRSILAGESVEPTDLGEYDLRFFDSADEMRDMIVEREQEHGLSRMVAGYGYKWRSQKDPEAFDIEVDGIRMKWNTSTVDWINSEGSADEVGSIHTVQGYDLNYAGVIIGPELTWDDAEGRVRVDRRSYFDTRGKQSIPRLGVETTDDDLRGLILNIYAVLMTRGMYGTYVWVHDEALRERLRPAFEGLARDR